MSKSRIRMRSNETQDSINENKADTNTALFYNAITDRIRDFRLHRQLTQEEFAEKIHVSTSAVRSVERYASAFRVHHLCKIVEVFPELSYRYLIEGKEERRNLTPISTNEKELLEELNKVKALNDAISERIRASELLNDSLKKELEILRGR